ncbi:kininogen-1 [Hoplias malabaricus]|uniref:kininogen-1 n=1 Tax=Hoplias malabaricus TaxID=27720 RepID=UPI003462F495
MEEKKILSLFFTLTCLFFVGSQGQVETRLQCDDKSVQDAVDLILLKYNKDLKEGEQLALYQVLQARKAQNESGEILSVRFSARETDCAAGGDKLWNQCDYLQDHLKLLNVCKAKVLLSEPNEVLSYECAVEPPVVADERPPCLGCPISIDVMSEDISESLSYSVFKANVVNNHPHFFILHNVVSATRQVIAGFRYRLQFEMEKSNCSKSEFKEVTEECHADQGDKLFINCNSTVDHAPWRHEIPDTTVQCAPGLLQQGRFTVRRRPPGFSPLRNIHNFMAVPPTKPTKKEESSEESQEGKVTTAKSPSAPAVPPPEPPKPDAPKPPRPAPPAPPAPERCPSKPWKEFNPVIAIPPPVNETGSSVSDAVLSV